MVGAELAGWRVAGLPGRVYPGLVAAPGGIARGVVVSGLTAAEWAVLDAFEDDEYDLRQVRLDDDSVWTYVWTSTVAQEDWYPDQFVVDHLVPFVDHCLTWRRGLYS